jgi:hypothetical protein
MTNSIAGRADSITQGQSLLATNVGVESAWGEPLNPYRDFFIAYSLAFCLFVLALMLIFEHRNPVGCDADVFGSTGVCSQAKHSSSEPLEPIWVGRGRFSPHAVTSTVGSFLASRTNFGGYAANNWP